MLVQYAARLPLEHSNVYALLWCSVSLRQGGLVATRHNIIGGWAGFEVTLSSSAICALASWAFGHVEVQLPFPMVIV